MYQQAAVHQTERSEQQQQEKQSRTEGAFAATRLVQMGSASYGGTLQSQHNRQASGSVVQRFGSEGGMSKSFEMESGDILQPRIISEIKSQIIEVPVIEERIRYVPKREVVEIEKKVAKYEYKYIEKVVEVPQVRYVDKFEEYDVVQEVVKKVPKKEFVNVPREYVRYVPKIETRVVEKFVEVLSRDKIIEVPKPYVVDQEAPYPVYRDKEMVCVVAQKMIPVVRESTVEVLDIEVSKYVPQVIPVDVYIPFGVQVPLIPVKKSEDRQFRVQVPVPQYNTLLVNLNSHFGGDVRLVSELPFQKGADGNIPLLLSDQYNSIVTISKEQRVVA